MQGPEGGVFITGAPGLEIDRIEGLHEWAHCPHAVRTPVMSVPRYAHTFELTRTVDIPGSRPPATTTTALPRVLILLRHWYDVILKMHAAGYSLRGDFCADNFVVVSFEGSFPEVRLTGSICLSTHDDDIGTMDYQSLASSIGEFFGVRGHVPHHIGEWLRFIAGGGRGVEYAMRYHPALMEPRQAFRSAMSLRRIMEHVRRTDVRLYRMIMHWGSHIHGWNFNNQCVNMLMDDARRHSLSNRGPKAPAPFEPNLRGMLKLARDCAEHAAVDHEEVMIFIAEQDFPGLVANTHLVMFRAGLLHRLHPETTMG